MLLRSQVPLSDRLPVRMMKKKINNWGSFILAIHFRPALFLETSGRVKRDDGPPHWEFTAAKWFKDLLCVYLFVSDVCVCVTQEVP